MNQNEKSYLRELAKKQLEYARLPIMEERKRLWYLHNELRGERPMVVMEEETFLDEILPDSRCESEDAKAVERQLQWNIAVHELIGDDKVIPDSFSVYFKFGINFLGQELKKTYASDGIGFHIEPVIENLEQDLEKLSASTFIYDENGTRRFADAVSDAIGDILPVRYENYENRWGYGITHRVVELMGMEAMLCSMMIEPEHFHRLMRIITDDMLRTMRWKEENGVLTLNNGNDFMGSGSYNFSRELPAGDYTGTVRFKDLWGNLSAQECVGISPEMFEEFVYPYNEELAKEFGFVYFGCCEPVSAFWDSGLKNLPNMRKVSISPWCDERYMSEQLSGGNIIYSRKPSPNHLGVSSAFDEKAFTADIANTAALTRDCKLEIIFRDIYKLGGNLKKVRRAVEITRRLTENLY